MLGSLETGAADVTGMTEPEIRTRVFVVSLDTATSRRDEFNRRAHGATLSWAFFDAHRGLTEGLSYNDEDALHHRGRTLNTGELGCYSSHVALWEQLLKDDADQYFILEDDVIVDWKALDIIASNDFTSSGMDYVRLYHKAPCSYIIRKRHFIMRTLSLLELTDWAYGTQGYIITKRGAEKLLAASRKVLRPIDEQLDRFWDHGVPNLCLFPFPLIDEAVPSSIEEARFDAMPKAELMRRVRRRYDRWKRQLFVRRRKHIKRTWDAAPYGNR